MIRLGVVFGSRSVEHEVSIITACQLMKHADPALYEIVPLYIDKQGRWWTGDPLKHIESYKKLDLRDPKIPDIHRVELLPDPTAFHPADVIIFCTHGGHGEDGTLAGLMELADIPYAAPGVVAAASTIDKIVTKHILAGAGIPTTKYFWFYRSEWESAQSSVLEQINNLEYPLFVKPASLGSSVGVSRVTNQVELMEAVLLAASFDQRIIVEEEARDCIEVNVSVVGNADSAQVSITEQPVKSDEFLSYADKYERGGKKTKGMASLSRRIPAPISPDLSDKIQNTALKVWKLIGGSGVTRVDFFANPSTEEIFLGELNNPPGSMAFYLWENSGMSYAALIDHLVAEAMKRADQKKQLLSSIDVNIL